MFGGQTPLRLARRLEEAGVPILGTPFDAIDIAEDRERFGGVLGRARPARARRGASPSDAAHAADLADEIGYPVLVRPSYVLGGREMRICYDRESLRVAAGAAGLAGRPVRRGRDRGRRRRGLRRRADAVIGAVMQHVEEAGVHSGDSTCVIPTLSLGEQVEQEIERQTAAIAMALGVRGLINVQFAVQGADVYVLEANPRASRTVPFVAKATGPGAGRGRLPGRARARGRAAAGRRPPTSA